MNAMVSGHVQPKETRVGHVAEDQPWGSEDGDGDPLRRVIDGFDIQGCPQCDGPHWGITLTPLPPKLQQRHNMTHAYGCPETGVTVAVQLEYQEPDDGGKPWQSDDESWRQ